MILHIYRLFRPRLALLNGVTALAGCALYPASISVATLLAAFCGVTLLAMGGSALNQLLECDVDALMERTMLRPLPRGKLSAKTAFSAGILVILAGLVPLSVGGMLLPPFVGAATFVLYVFIYTPLKRKTAFALPLGALCGAVPPLIGWCLAGGAPTDYRIIILAGVLFVWQIPHFWLLQERHEADYRRAGLPLVGSQGNPISRNALLRLWLVAFIAIALLLPAFNIIARPAAFCYVALLVIMGIPVLMHSRRVLFVCLNLFPLLVTLILLVRT